MRVVTAPPAGVRTVVCYARTANPGTVGPGRGYGRGGARR